ncbi:MAG: hypothetical protein QME64_05625, partial [bacterium]|nr:hypothetical protein [bacterium]
MKKFLISFLLVVILMVMANVVAMPTGRNETYYAPISKSVEAGAPLGEDSHQVYRAWNSEEQKKLYQRTEKAVGLISLSLFTSDINFKQYREITDHDQLKEKLRSLVDNETAWPEYIYIARLVDSETTYIYQVLCSSSDIIEEGTLRDIEINEKMQLALELKKPIATDLFSPFGEEPPTHAAVYYPFFSGDTSIGMLVFVKGFWEEKKPSVEERLSALERSVRRLESQIAQLQATPTTAKPKPSAAVEIKEKDLLQLSYGEGRMDGKRSYGGGGHAIFFQHPTGAFVLKYVELFGSRYGYPQPPAEDFSIYVLDENMKVLHTIPISYSTFERGAEKWVAMPVGNLAVPEKYWVAFAFNAHQTKGIYVG